MESLMARQAALETQAVQVRRTLAQARSRGLFEGDRLVAITTDGPAVRPAAPE
jgi:hypothetical protein